MKLGKSRLHQQSNHGKARQGDGKERLGEVHCLQNVTESLVGYWSLVKLESAVHMELEVLNKASYT